MKKRGQINPNTIKIIFYIVTALLILGINFFCTRILLRKSNSISTEQYLDSCNRVTDGYAETIEAKIEVCKTALNTFYFPQLYKNMTTEQIQSFIMEHSDKKHSDFKSVIYVDKSGMAYTDSGKTYDASGREYFKQIMHKGKSEYISDQLRSILDYSPLFVYSKAIYDNDGHKKGVLCASINVDTLSDVINNISIDRQGGIIVQDMAGEFIAHPSQAWIAQVFNPYILNLNLATNSSPSEKIHRIETTNVSGKPIYIFHRQIYGTTWNVGYCVPTSILHQISETQNHYQILLITISFMATIAIILLELYLTNYFQKRQMVEVLFDPLTHLMTRERFEREANKMLIHNPHSKFLLIESDIRGFKFYNQTLGEMKSDNMLVFFSKMLNETTIGQKGLVCRGYADRFYSFYKIKSVQSAMKAFTDTLEKGGELIRQSENPFIPKFGLAFYLPKSEHGIVSVQHLIGHATFAKKSIKDNALHQYAIYDEKLSNKSKEENYIELHMEKALENEEFFVMYQPKMDLKTEKIAGAEALVRWENEKLGFMAPNKFIPLFEKNNFIVRLDFEVYRQVFKFIRKCLDNNIPVVPISVNMSRNHDKPEKFVHDLISLMKEYDVPAKYVEVELLERSSMEKNTLRDITLMLHKEGLTVAMDDFGSGESSLNMLSNIPVDVLKFDRSFLLTSNMENGKIDEEKAIFIETLVDLGKNMKKHTVFEGVETAEQRDFLKAIDCDTVQGYFYSKPLREADYIEFVKTHL